MHEAVAGLFEGDREALKASALAAGYEGDLPEKFVIAGHSGGGQLAAGAAGYYYRSLASGEESDLVGVLLYDTSATGGALERALVDLPPELPVLHIAAEPSAWDTFGNASDVLVAKRPNQFNGVQLIGGTHSDAFRSSTLFGLLQPLVALGTGASTPENVEAVTAALPGLDHRHVRRHRVYKQSVHGAAGHLRNTGKRHRYPRHRRPRLRAAGSARGVVATRPGHPDAAEFDQGQSVRDMRFGLCGFDTILFSGDCRVTNG